jgi:hypothetical protein
MSERVRPPTDDFATEVYDPERQSALLGTPAGTVRRPASATLPAPAGAPPPTAMGTGTTGRTDPGTDSLTDLQVPMPAPPAHDESFEGEATAVTPRPGRAQIELATPTEIDPQPAAPAAPVARGASRSEPIRVISMKDPSEPQKPRAEGRVPLHVQLRSMAEVAGRDAPIELGRLAPPRDPKQARARRRRANLLWACVAVALACAITLACWLVAGR